MYVKPQHLGVFFFWKAVAYVATKGSRQCLSSPSYYNNVHTLTHKISLDLQHIQQHRKHLALTVSSPLWLNDVSLASFIRLEGMPNTFPARRYSVAIISICL